jgi:DNA-binding transcriptional MocR family regulator
LLALKSSRAEQAWMEELAEKANEGTLTPEERRVYETWVRAGAFISLLQAKARLYRRKLASATLIELGEWP